MSSFDQLTELENSVQSVADVFSDGSEFRNDLERIADGITPPVGIEARDDGLEVINLTAGLVYIGDQLARVVDRLEVIADALPLVEN
jgi:hypothetical protein